MKGEIKLLTEKEELIAIKDYQTHAEWKNIIREWTEKYAYLFEKQRLFIQFAPFQNSYKNIW